jgi:hypothetical protein
VIVFLLGALPLPLMQGELPNTATSTTVSRTSTVVAEREAAAAKSGFLGIIVGQHRIRGALGQQESTGLIVLSVIDGSPADRAGITTGTRITSVDNIPVSTKEDYLAWLQDHAPGDRVIIGVMRQSDTEELLTIELGRPVFRRGGEQEAPPAAHRPEEPPMWPEPMFTYKESVGVEDPWLPLEESHHRFGLDAGIGSAIGFIGATYAFAPVTPLLLEAGIGYGGSGLQLSAMPKLALGLLEDRFILGAGWSMGIVPGTPKTGSPCTGACANDATGNIVHFVNVDVGYEHRNTQHFSMQFSIGMWGIVAANGPNLSCRISSPIIGCQNNDVSFQARFGVGYWIF